MLFVSVLHIRNILYPDVVEAVIVGTQIEVEEAIFR